MYKIATQHSNWLLWQLQLLRTYPTVQGSVYYSSKSFKNNPNSWNDSLQNNYYRNRVLVPPMDWLPGNPSRNMVKESDPVNPSDDDITAKSFIMEGKLN